jgi:hypothetical protein
VGEMRDDDINLREGWSVCVPMLCCRLVFDVSATVKWAGYMLVELLKILRSIVLLGGACHSASTTLCIRLRRHISKPPLRNRTIAISREIF